jgi:FkbM family methyltransferase
MKLFKRQRGARNFLRKSITQKYLGRISKEYIKTKDQLVVFSFDFISQSIAINGRFEDNELKLLENIFSQRLKSRTILDIGANIGNHTVAFSKIANNVISFEPNSVIFDVLKINTQNIPNVEIFNYGASDTNQILNAKIPRGNCGEGSVAKKDNDFKAGQFYELQFDLRVLDEVEELSKMDIGLIKIDVEGHELKSFLGMKNLLVTQKPMILFEQNRGIRNGTSDEIDFLRTLGYEHLYEFKNVEKWITPNCIPKSLKTMVRFIEVLIFGEPSDELRLSEISSLDNKSYDMLVFSFEKI